MSQNHIILRRDYLIFVNWLGQSKAHADLTNIPFRKIFIHTTTEFNTTVQVFLISYAICRVFLQCFLNQLQPDYPAATSGSRLPCITSIFTFLPTWVGSCIQFNYIPIQISSSSILINTQCPTQQPPFQCPPDSLRGTKYKEQSLD